MGMIIYIDVNGTLDTLNDVQAAVLLVRLRMLLPDDEVVVWSSDGDLLAQWRQWMAETEIGCFTVATKDISFVVRGDVVVDDDEMIRKASARRGARVFGPEDLERLPDLLVGAVPAGTEDDASEHPWEELSSFHLFHRLWTKAVGQPGYIKAQWRKLETMLLDK